MRRPTRTGPGCRKCPESLLGEIKKSTLEKISLEKKLSDKEQPSWVTIEGWSIASRRNCKCGCRPETGTSPVCLEVSRKSWWRGQHVTGETLKKWVGLFTKCASQTPGGPQAVQGHLQGQVYFTVLIFALLMEKQCRSPCTYQGRSTKLYSSLPFRTCPVMPVHLRMALLKQRNY